MFSLFKKKDNSPILVSCDTKHIRINGREIAFPLHLNTLTEILGKPSRQEHDLLWRVTWDHAGVYAEYATWDKLLAIKFLLSDNHKLSYFPTHFFKGKILVDEKEVQYKEGADFSLGKNRLKHLIYKGEQRPYAVSIGKNFSYKEAIPENKYHIKDWGREQIKFRDWGFKLSIIQELMYRKKLLRPKFDLYEFVEWYDKREIDIEKEGYELIPEVTQYFRDLQVPKKLADEVTEIYQDGGNEIYLQLLRFGEGWEDYWDIETTEDAELFPNLKKVRLCYAKKNVREEFKEMGIDVEWV